MRAASPTRLLKAVAVFMLVVGCYAKLYLHMTVKVWRVSRTPYN